MFSTYSRNEVALAGMAGEMRTWMAIDLHLEMCWFFCALAPDETGAARSCLVCNPSQVSELTVGQGDPAGLQLTIATPPHVNGSGEWRFQRLKSIWLCEEPAVPQHAWIFETAQDDAYALSLLGTGLSDLRRIQTLYSAS